MMLHAMKRTNIQRIWTCLWLAVAVLMHSGLHAQTYISVRCRASVLLRLAVREQLWHRHIPWHFTRP